ncbi:hypothetical protein G0Q06_11890 [Puniceicoccales bacterium CK1056]|uniref:Methyltransferase domain-containing protein n=1 Tax=Oceanipulchritudo coccoides TaxID=2706888 RepID=A0A6B2M482_9BACT|nr:hypothetical protein [Oceanipulchritudo coccoides]NDV63156.1 hypothetical protein [Oceanipulchritudo coccoides]
MPRIVEPELLDTLPPDDPAALASRKDLRLYNHLMGNFQWFKKKLAQGGYPKSIIELGAGDGSLALYLKNHDCFQPDTVYTGVDLIPAPANWPGIWTWEMVDLVDLDLIRSPSTLLANLILHQFTDEELTRLGKKISASNIKRLLICEPARRRLHIWQIRLSRLLGCHPVSLHDGQVSIRAGFRRDELVRIMGLKNTEWKITFSETFMGANRLICTRR